MPITVIESSQKHISCPAPGISLILDFPIPANCGWFSTYNPYISIHLKNTSPDFVQSYRQQGTGGGWITDGYVGSQHYSFYTETDADGTWWAGTNGVGVGISFLQPLEEVDIARGGGTFPSPNNPHGTRNGNSLMTNYVASHQSSVIQMVGSAGFASGENPTFIEATVNYWGIWVNTPEPIPQPDQVQRATYHNNSVLAWTVQKPSPQKQPIMIAFSSSPQKFVNPGTVNYGGWSQYQYSLADSGSGLGLEFLPNGLLYLSYLSGGNKVFSINRRFGDPLGWNPAVNTNPSVDQHLGSSMAGLKSSRVRIS